MDRRSHRRVKASGKVFTHLLDASQIPMEKAINGVLSDISAGGLSFNIKASTEETARMLLGRNVNTQINIQAGDFQHNIDRNGTVVAVQYHLFNDYSVHVKFEENLNEKIIEEIGVHTTAAP